VTVLPLRFFHRPAAEVARDLLGAVVVSRVGGVLTSGRIIETEAYLGHEDPASHAYRGRRHAQNEGIYSPPGSWYVYRSYGMHWCANLVCAPEGLGAAVLLRAVEPLEGVEVMRARRRWRGSGTVGLADGPGKLTAALGITREMDRQRMSSSRVTVLRGRRLPEARVEMTERIGISKAADWPLRYVVRK
jgi:DNA-3-methyladenine glycosylase